VSGATKRADPSQDAWRAASRDDNAARPAALKIFNPDVTSHAL
jgi:hypothetical protein